MFVAVGIWLNRIRNNFLTLAFTLNLWLLRKFFFEIVAISAFCSHTYIPITGISTESSHFEFRYEKVKLA